MREHQVAPHDFLISSTTSRWTACPRTAASSARSAACPGRKLVFTNGDAGYAGRVLDRLGLAQSFEAIHDIHACGYLPKPDPASYASLWPRSGRADHRAVRRGHGPQLVPAKALGMTTVWVDNGSEAGGHGADPAAIDYTISDGRMARRDSGDHA
jgi:putative hydrolase of the HAD superfamily